MKTANRILVIAFACGWPMKLVAATALADIGPAQIQDLERGRVFVSAENSASGQGVHIVAAIDVAMPAEAIWPIMTNCDRAPSFVPNLISCRILERDPKGAWDVREHVSSPAFFLPNFRTVFRSDYELNRRIHFARVAGDLKNSDGQWLLVPLNEGRATRVVYTADTEYRSWAPNGWMRNHLSDEIVRVMEALRRECVKRERDQR